MQSFNEYNEHANLHGTSVDIKGNILSNLKHDASHIEDFGEGGDGDMEKL